MSCCWLLGEASCGERTGCICDEEGTNICDSGWPGDGVVVSWNDGGL